MMIPLGAHPQDAVVSVVSLLVSHLVIHIGVSSGHSFLSDISEKLW